MRLYINVDHVATVRQARRTDEPDPVAGRRAVRAGGRGRHHRAPARGPAAHPGRRRRALSAAVAGAQPRDGHQRRHGRPRLPAPAVPGHAGARAARGDHHRGRARPQPRRPARLRETIAGWRTPASGSACSSIPTCAVDRSPPRSSAFPPSSCTPGATPHGWRHGDTALRRAAARGPATPPTGPRRARRPWAHLRQRGSRSRRSRRSRSSTSATAW